MDKRFLLRDVDGVLRFPVDVGVSEATAKEILEVLWVKNKINLSLKQLDVSFSDYDEVMGFKRKNTARKWTTDEERYVLLHHEDGDDAVGRELKRSNMSIFMAKAHILSDFDSWRQDNLDLLVGKTREEVVDLYLGEEEEED